MQLLDINSHFIRHNDEIRLRLVNKRESRPLVIRLHTAIDKSKLKITKDVDDPVWVKGCRTNSSLEDIKAEINKELGKILM
jgi:hypothetical protein